MSIIDEINRRIDGDCSCGRKHEKITMKTEIYAGAIKTLPGYVKEFGCKKAFVIADRNTYAAAGARVCQLLEDAGISYSKYVFRHESGKALEPDEHAAGSAIMNFESDCDIIIGVGSGVINDIAKIIAERVKVTYIIVATAPSMDGYASATSSVFTEGRKFSIKCALPDVIIGDTDIVKNAPIRMLTSGLGDMLAKYLSILEWRISNVVTGEFYCETIASVIRGGLKKCVDNADGLLKRDEQAVNAVMEGLIASGLGMKLAGISRPASGIEHSISHIWDMRALEFGTPSDFHGIQCGIGTLIGFRLFAQLKNTVPDREKALRHAAAFSFESHSEMLRRFIGKGAEIMIELEARDGKYDTEKHKERLSAIIDNWDKIISMIDSELPCGADGIEKLLDTIGCPKSPSEIGIPEQELPLVLASTMDIRDKYVLSRLLWDLGIIDEVQFGY